MPSLSKLLPVFLALSGLGIGAMAGHFLRPAPAEAGAESAVRTEPVETAEGAEDLVEYVKLNNQFIVPLIERGQVASLVVLSISLEVVAGSTE